MLRISIQIQLIGGTTHTEMRWSVYTSWAWL